MFRKSLASHDRRLALVIGLILVMCLYVKLASQKPFKDDQMGIGGRQKGQINQGYSLLTLCCANSEFDAGDQSQGSNSASRADDVETSGPNLDAENERARGSYVPREKAKGLYETSSGTARLPANGVAAAETLSFPINISAPPPIVKADNSNENLSEAASRDPKHQQESLIKPTLSGLQFGEEGYKVLHLFGQLSEGERQGLALFKDCRQSKCILSNSADTTGSKHVNSDAIIFDIASIHFAKQLLKPPNQVWILNLMESPLNTPNISSVNGLINWTATYRTDSTVHAPYNEHQSHGPGDAPRSFQDLRSVVNSKTKLVAWFASNCGSKNGRLKYVQELQKYIPVDVYGHCGPLVCEREEENLCLQKLRKDYKFYLSFENSNCKDYLSEKFWKALR